MKLKPLLIHPLLDCFDRKYNDRVSRGASWFDYSRWWRALNRDYFGLSNNPDNHGFRLAKQANEFKTTSNPQTA
jgi:hypothetical protein